MGVLARFPGVSAVLAIALLLPASAAAQGRLSPVSQATVASTFEPSKGDHKAELAVSVRNDSGFRGALRVRLVYDDGTTTRARKKRRSMNVGEQKISVWLDRRGKQKLRIGPRDVKRVKVQAWTDELPKAPLSGTLIVATRKPGNISPLTVPLKLSPPAEKPAIWHEAKVKPAKVLVTVHRWLPGPLKPSWLITDAQDVAVEGLAAGEELPEGTFVTEPVAASDTGGRGHVTISAPDGIDPATKTGTLRADVEDVTLHGTYEAAVKLAPDDEKSAAITVQVKARDLVIWPLLMLLLGAVLAYRQLGDAEKERPKRILRLALTKLQAVHGDDHDDEDSPIPYELDVFPSDWGDCSKPKKEAHKLYCRIGEADLSEELDDIQKEIADLDARVRLWPVSRAKVAALAEAREKLPADDMAADAIRTASEKLETREKPPATESATKAYHAELDAQVEAIETWILASAMLAAAARIHDRRIEAGDADVEVVRRHNPRRWQEDLEEATGPDDLERCGVFDGLCRDLHLLRSLDLTKPPEPPVESYAADLDVEGLGRFTAAMWPYEVDPGAVRAFMFRKGPPRREPTEAEQEEREAEPEPVDAQAPKGRPDLPLGPSHREPSPSISAGLLDGLKAGDTRSFWWAFAIATLAYLLGIYGDTFGSITEYLTAFAAGAGSMYVANYKLLPWFRSYRPAKSS